MIIRTAHKTLIKTSILFYTLFITACGGGGQSPVKYTETNTGIVSTQHGHDLFMQKCAACHGVGGDAQGNGAANLQLSRLDSASIVLTIKNGRSTMPPFKDAIPDSDMAALAVYVKSLRK